MSRLFTDPGDGGDVEASATIKVIGVENGNVTIDVELRDEQGNSLVTLHRAQMRVGDSLVFDSLRVDIHFAPTKLH